MKKWAKWLLGSVIAGVILAGDILLWTMVYRLVPNELALLAPIILTFLCLVIVFSRLRLSRHPKWQRFLMSTSTVGVLLCFAAPVMFSFYFVSVRNKVVTDIRLQKVINYAPTIATIVYDRNGKEMCVFARENRIEYELKDISSKIREAFIAAEDGDFYTHAGIDLSGIVRAMYVNFESGHSKQGASTITQQIIKGLWKNNEKTYQRKIEEAISAVEIEKRLTKEQILWIYLNEIYLGNNAYGVGAAMKMYFNKTPSDRDVTWGEAAMLAGLAKAPANDSPHNHADQAYGRFIYVLKRLLVKKKITQEEYDAALFTPLILAKNATVNTMVAPYACEEIRRELLEAYGEDVVYGKGLTVYSTIDLRWQAIAQDVVMNGIETYEKVVGDGEGLAFIGPSGHDDSRADGKCAMPNMAAIPLGARDEQATISAISKNGMMMCVFGNDFPLSANDAKKLLAWQKNGRMLRVGDMIPMRLYEVETKEKIPVTTSTKDKKKKYETVVKKTRYAFWAPRTTKAQGANPLQAALVSVDQNSGEVRAVVGGYDFFENQFNLATQGHPQVGSSIKPFVYLAGLLDGMTPTDIVTDRFSCVGNWCPANYDGKYQGSMPLRTALARSRNSIAVQIMGRVGVSKVLDVMAKLGIDTTGTNEAGARFVPFHPTISIGSAAIPLWQQVMGFAAIAANGKEMPREEFGAYATNDSYEYRRTGILVTKILDQQGSIIYQKKVDVAKDQPQAVPADAAYAMVYLMRGAIEDDGGTATRVRELERPIAGKTGTSDDEQNLWFVGFTADMVTGVWVGREKPEHVGHKATGGGAALPFWLEFMKRVYALDSAGLPAKEFAVPDEVVRVYRDGKVIPYLQGAVPKEIIDSVDFSRFSPMEPLMTEEEPPK